MLPGQGNSLPGFLDKQVLLTALAFTVSDPPGAGQRGRISPRCPTEFREVTHGQGVRVLLGRAAVGPRAPSAARPDRAHKARNYSFPSRSGASPGVMKVNGAASHQLPSARGSALTRAGGRPGERSLLPTPSPGERGCHGHHEQTGSLL